MFRLHGNGRDQTRPHRHRAVSDLTHPATPVLRTLHAETLTVAPSLAPQVQEADGLQAEEAAAADQEAALSPPAPDDAQRQLSQGLEPGASSFSKVWCRASSCNNNNNDILDDCSFHY